MRLHYLGHGEARVGVRLLVENGETNEDLMSEVSGANAS